MIELFVTLAVLHIMCQCHLVYSKYVRSLFEIYFTCCNADIEQGNGKVTKWKLANFVKIWEKHR